MARYINAARNAETKDGGIIYAGGKYFRMEGRSPELPTCFKRLFTMVGERYGMSTAEALYKATRERPKKSYGKFGFHAEVCCFVKDMQLFFYIKGRKRNVFRCLAVIESEFHHLMPVEYENILSETGYEAAMEQAEK
jgi:hypothetical protein